MPEKISDDISQAKESGEALDRKIIWMVEDNDEFAQSFLRLTKAMPNLQADFACYQTGEEAVAEFEQIAKTKGQSPSIILMDYQLDQGVENPRYRNGVEVINKLKKISQEYGLDLPEIISTSGNDESVQLLMQAGASSAVGKLELSKFIKRFVSKT